jgi:hypothetical protein
VLRWITNQDSESRGERFWKFEAKQKVRLAEVVNKYPPSSRVTFTLRPEVQQVAHDYPNWHSWGPGMKAMATEPEVLDTGAFLNTHTMWTYDSLYFFSSCFLHPTAIGLGHEVLRHGSIFSTNRTDNEDGHAMSAMGATAAVIVRIGNRASVFWGLGLSDEIEQTWRKQIGPLIDR